MKSAHRLASVLVSVIVLVSCSKQPAQDADMARSPAVTEGDSQPGQPTWVRQIARLKAGATRAEVERLLPHGFTTAPAFGSSGMHREFYSVSKDWQIAVVYRFPDMRYRRSPDQKLIASPRITRTLDDTRETYVD